MKKAIADFGIKYPVAVDNNYKIWQAFENSYWPAHYFIDAKGQIRYHHFGEGEYDKSEQVIRELLAEAGHGDVGKMAAVGAGAAEGTVQGMAWGVELAADARAVQSPETYVGYARAENFASPGGARQDATKDYSAPVQPALNQWGLAGQWNIGDEHASLVKPDGRIEIGRAHV